MSPERWSSLRAVAGQRFDFLHGEIVNQLWFWGMIRLVFDQESGPPWYVDVQHVRVVQPDGSSLLIDAAGPPLDTAPMLQLLKQTVADASAENGLLKLRFGNGLTLEALSSDKYESWTVAGQGRVTQCMPGGETDSW